jgi:hypothetical protein
VEKLEEGVLEEVDRRVAAFEKVAEIVIFDFSY